MVLLQGHSPDLQAKGDQFPCSEGEAGNESVGMGVLDTDCCVQS
jgi:hypothetical protein